MTKAETPIPNHIFKDKVGGDRITVKATDAATLTHLSSIFIFGSKITNEQLMFMCRGGILVFKENKWVESND